MKRLVATVLALAILVAYQLPAIAAAQNTGDISGTAVVDGKPLPKIMVRLRNVDIGQVVASQITNEMGEFQFTGLAVGTYVVEIVADNKVLGTSARIAIVAGALRVGGVVVSTTSSVAAAAGVGAAGAAAGAGAAGAAAGAAAAGAGFFATTAGLITIAAIGAGIAAGVVAATGTASPSQ